MLAFLQRFRKATTQSGEAPPRQEAGPLARFVLRVGNTSVGTLTRTPMVWRWEYTPEFAAQTTLRAIPSFPDKTRVYESEILWPFFAARLPNLKQPGLRELLERDRVSPDDQVEQLRRYGQRSPTNPFTLQAA